MNLMTYTINRNANPQAAVVLLIPGVGCGAKFWDDGIEALKPTHTVICFNNPGMGDAKKKAPFTVNELALAVLSIVDEMGIENAHILGHSMGGFVAQRIALLRPTLVDKLMLISTSTGGMNLDDDITHVLEEYLPVWPEKRKLLHEDPAEAFRFAVASDTPEKKPEGYRAFVENRTNPRVPEEIYAAHFWAAMHFSSRSWAASIHAPTLVMHGDEDNIINNKGGRELAAMLPNATFVDVHAGHLPSFELPDFWQYITDFIAGKTIGQPLPAAKPLSADELAEDDKWLKKRTGNLSLVGLLALARGLPVGLRSLLGKK